MSEEGTRIEEDLSPRAYQRLGTGRVISKGLPRDAWRDAYHILLTIPLWAFLVVMAVGFLAINSLFALIYLYMADPGGVAGTRPGNFADHFFFSVQTMASVGYGVMYPRSFHANVIMSVEAFVGMFNLAIATGLLFARFSRPTARIMFSNIAVVAPFEGAPALMFRAANRRRNLVVEAEVNVSLVRDVVTSEGVEMRRFYDLPLLRSRSPLFFLTWQVMHAIDEQSPLFGETARSLLEKHTEILVVMKGLDETFASTIHARGSYTPEQIVWGRPFANIFSADGRGRRQIDFRRFHEAE
ncbi:MAG TPA: ion channel [Caulobacteraceae bacterium]|nr:ion channel [Caulobacteraceae bacterium]